jgi:hypothetical protein
VRIRRLEVQGFRGFNEERSIDFNERLTLIYAPNSYGKTSISEALEWLLYGVTSKVERADSKEEYKGSYRNRHFPESRNPSVRVYFMDGSTERVFTAELTSDDGISRFLSADDARTKVSAWPMDKEIQEAPRPFVLQHALKYLLLVKPDERFQGFARLLGFEELTDMQRHIISLCTAPERKIPVEITKLLQDVTSLQQRLAARPSLASVHRAFRRKDAKPEDIHKSIIEECKRRVPTGTPDNFLLEALRKIRDDAVGGVFKGRIALPDYSDEEAKLSNQDQAYLVGAFTEEFAAKYAELTALSVKESVLKLAEFYELGVELLHEGPGICPFCGQSTDEAIQQHISRAHTQLRQQTSASQALELEREAVKDTLEKLQERITVYQDRNISKTMNLLALEPSLPQLEKILASSHPDAFSKTQTAVLDVCRSKNNVDMALEEVTKALESVSQSIEVGAVDVELLKGLGEKVVHYLAEVQSLKSVVSDLSPKVAAADHILQQELDAIAGTEDVSLLIELAEAERKIAKKIQVDFILEGLKTLRKSMDQYVADTILDAISGELTADVMEWYARVKTTGDPDVHFSGFDLDRTQKGDIKARRVNIKAESYGRELVSAVSSLSESKLNALGLCVSIATNLKGDSPFEFLIIDDPIQSLDAEHETQFVQIIRSLVLDHSMQTIVLSHNRRWLEALRTGCQSIDGWFYEITGYTLAGPNIEHVAWEKWQDRLATVDAILKDPKADSVRLQQAEAEIRIMVTQLAADLYKKAKGVNKSPNTLNSTQVRKMFIECGVDSGLVDRIAQTFCTTDDSHHAPAAYSPDRERIRRFHAWAHELSRLVP